MGGWEPASSAFCMRKKSFIACMCVVMCSHIVVYLYLKRILSVLISMEILVNHSDLSKDKSGKIIELDVFLSLHVRECICNCGY